jgi:hypothetical protein
VSAAFLRSVDARAGGRTRCRGAALSSVSVESACPVVGHRRGVASQEHHLEALLGADAEGWGR